MFKIQTKEGHSTELIIRLLATEVRLVNYNLEPHDFAAVT